MIGARVPSIHIICWASTNYEENIPIITIAPPPWGQYFYVLGPGLDGTVASRTIAARYDWPPIWTGLNCADTVMATPPNVPVLFEQGAETTHRQRCSLATTAVFCPH